jgi:hypothetical protein
MTFVDKLILVHGRDEIDATLDKPMALFVGAEFILTPKSDPRSQRLFVVSQIERADAGITAYVDELPPETLLTRTTCSTTWKGCTCKL